MNNLDLCLEVVSSHVMACAQFKFNYDLSLTQIVFNNFWQLC